MTRSCAVCGAAFEASKPQARFCGATCRKRNSRGAGTPSSPAPSQPSGPAGQVVPAVGLIASVVNELTAAGRMGSVLGQQALRLAVRLETSTVDTGAGLASLSKELRAVMAAALAGATTEADPVDELKARRDAKRANAG